MQRMLTAAYHRDKILNFLESHNSVAVVAADPDAAFAAFAAEFHARRSGRAASW